MAQIFIEIRKKIDAELLIVGDGQEMKKTKDLLKRGGVDKDVRYIGLDYNVVPLLSQSDLLLNTSFSESFCLVALEAMACGVPALASKVGGVPEVVLHKKTGFLFPLHDCYAGVDFAIQLLSNPVKLKTMREAAIIHAQKFNLHKIVNTYENLYKDLLSRKVMIKNSPKYDFQIKFQESYLP